MATQRELFDVDYRYPSPPHCGVLTSIEAAESVIENAASYRARVFRFIESRGELGATREEIEIGLGMRGNTVRPRVKELEAAGLIIVTEKTRMTTSGRKANVIIRR